jgi:hypothetical protein
MRKGCSSRGGWCLKSLAWGVRYIKLRCTSGLAEGFAGRWRCVEEDGFRLGREEVSSSQTATIRVGEVGRRGMAWDGSPAKTDQISTDPRWRPGWCSKTEEQIAVLWEL